MITLEAELVVATDTRAFPVIQYQNPETKEWCDFPQRIDMQPMEDVTRESPDAKIIETQERRQLVFEYEKKQYVVELPSAAPVRKILTRQAAEVEVVKPERWVNDKQEVVEEAAPVLPGVVVKEAVVDDGEAIKTP